MSKLISLHLFSDASLFVSYSMLSIWVASMFRRITLGNRFLTLGFGMFILLCGITHLDTAIAELNNYCPVSSMFGGIVKAATALVAACVAFAAWANFLRARIALGKASGSLGDPKVVQQTKDSLTNTVSTLNAVCLKLQKLVEQYA